MVKEPDVNSITNTNYNITLTQANNLTLSSILKNSSHEKFK